MGKVDDALARLAEIADELNLDDDDDRENFISSSMARMGFTQTSAWAEPDDGKNGNSGGDFFSKNSGKPRETRRVPKQGLTRYGS
jgi:hypothetical protein